MPTDTSAILTGLAGRDINAFRHLYQCYYKPLVLFALRYVEEMSAAEDMVEDVFVAMWENGTAFADKRALEGYLYNAVRNRCVDLLRRQGVHSRYAEEMLRTCSDTTDGEQAHSLEMRYIRLFDAIDALPPRPREVMLLYIEGMKNQEIAERLSLSVETVKVHRKRALAMLRQSIGDIVPVIYFMHYLMQCVFGAM